MPNDTTDVPTLEYWAELCKIVKAAQYDAREYLDNLPDEVRKSQAASRAIMRRTDLDLE